VTERHEGRAFARARAADARSGQQHDFRDQPGHSVAKLETGIPGFDAVTMGGLPLRRATVLAGQAGSGKTVFASHFLAEGVLRGQPGVFVTLEEPANDLRANLATLGWDTAAWEARTDFAFVDASPLVRDDGNITTYNFDTLAAQIGHAVDATGAERLVLDSLNTVLAFETSPALARQRLRGLIGTLRAMGLTVMLTVETPGDPGTTLSRYGLEEFVADSVVLLRHIHEGVVRRRSVEVLKMRGAMHRKGDYSFTVLPGQGVVVLPQAVIDDDELPPPRRIPTGNAGLDRMTNGGFFQDSTVLISGPTGTGKTLLSTKFVAEGAAAGENAMLLPYEESTGQLVRNARAWGTDLKPHLDSGLLRIVARYPEVASLDDHLVELMELVAEHSPTRLAIDSLSSLERIGSPASYRRFLTGLTSFVKNSGIATLLTLNSSTLIGSATSSEGEISTMSDGLILLRYAEVDGRVQRAMTLLKLRGTGHDHDVREYHITDEGLVVGEPLAGRLDVVPAANLSSP
jgi:circadian clock protein KaiC